MTKIVLEHITWEDIQEIIEEDGVQYKQVNSNPVSSAEEYYTRVLNNIKVNNGKQQC